MTSISNSNNSMESSSNNETSPLLTQQRKETSSKASSYGTVQTSTQQAFQSFLDTKQKDGLSRRDFLQDRYIRYCDSHGFFESALNFLLLGWLGCLVIKKGNNGKVDIGQLRAETDFYKLCTQTQNFYNQFHNKPVDKNFKAASDAFEELHKIVGKQGLGPEAHQQINDILNKLVGANVNVAQELLEYFACDKLMQGGQLTSDNLIKFYKEYQWTVLDKAQKGYGETGIDTNKGTVSDNKNTVRMIFARAFRNIIEMDEDSNSLTYIDVLKGLDINTENEESLIQASLLSINDQLLKAMTIGEPNESLSMFVPEAEQEELISSYQAYIQLEEDITKTQLEYLEKQEQAVTAEKELQCLLKKENSCSYSLLAPLFAKSTNPLPEGFGNFTQVKEGITSLKKEIIELAEQIEVYKKGIEKEYLEEVEELTKKIEKLKDSIELAKWAIEERKKAVHQAECKVKTTSSRADVSQFNRANLSHFEEAVEAQEEYTQELKELAQLTDALKAKETALGSMQRELDGKPQQLLNKQKEELESYEACLKNAQSDLATMQSEETEEIMVTGAAIYNAKTLFEQDSRLSEVIYAIETQAKKVIELRLEEKALGKSIKRFESDKQKQSNSLVSLGFNLEDSSLNYTGLKDKNNQILKNTKDMILASFKTARYYLSSDWFVTMAPREKANVVTTRGSSFEIDSTGVKMFYTYPSREMISAKEGSGEEWDKEWIDADGSVASAVAGCDQVDLDKKSDSSCASSLEIMGRGGSNKTEEKDDDDQSLEKLLAVLDDN